MTTPFAQLVAPRAAPTESDRALRRFARFGERPVCTADWSRALFVHYAIDPAVLQPHVPFPLDLYDGRAYVTLVAFAQRNVRPRFSCGFGRLGRRIAARCARPVAEHAFLNLRTYVRHQGERGIYFIAEWIDNPLDRIVGPITYGLPYRLGNLRYEFDEHGLPLGGEVTARAAAAGAFRFTAQLDPGPSFELAAAGLDRFLLERYAAYTRHGSTLRRFRIWHAPWTQARATVRAHTTSLLTAAAPWFGACRYVGANFSPGVKDVRIGPPRKLPPNPIEPVRPGPIATTAVMSLLASMPAAALWAEAPRWALMWSIALALFFAGKWITWLRAPGPLLPLPQGESGPGAARSVAYLFGWVGMDAATFLDETRMPPRPPLSAWIAPITKAAGGTALLWGLARLAARDHPLGAGWVGMIGLVLLLHFGAFHLLALLWRRAGVDAVPIMREPLRSKSLAEFWGVRWNRGFHQLAHDLVFRPLVRLGLRPPAALLATFVASGLVHELVISLPAAGGWGLPTLYFAIQGVAVLLQRSATGRRLGVGSGLRGRVFTLACTILPLPWLFHPAFVQRVVIPFLHAIGAF